jgi:alkanesulfonate monooxygenase SsuD/methylene tetrahydromethanopterin reductase-like flavin-dependent oxidoreductase (luciferase family)
MQLAFARLRSGRPGQLPRPVERIEDHIDPGLMAVVDQALACTAVGTAETVRETIRGFLARYEPDEVILTGQIHDHAARLRSFEIAAEAIKGL